MKCLYYLAPTLDSTRSISNDLHAVGVSDWYIHVVSRDEAGLKKEHIHSSNYIETYDFVRTGLLGASIGFLVGLGAAFVLSATKAFGTNVTLLPHLAVIFVAVLFGAWMGGLLGMGSENKKLVQFHGEIKNGKYLFLIYSAKGKGEAIKTMMRERHPESEHVATDKHFISPFSDMTRKNHAAP